LSGDIHINDLGFLTAHIPKRLEDSRRSGQSITSLLVSRAKKKLYVFYNWRKLMIDCHLSILINESYVFLILLFTYWENQSYHSLWLNPAFSKPISNPRRRTFLASRCRWTATGLKFISEITLLLTFFVRFGSYLFHISILTMQK